MRNPLRRKHRNKQRGQGMVEYAVIVALIGIAAITTVTYFGKDIQYQFSGMAHEMAGTSADTDTGHAGDAADAASEDADRTKNMGDYNNGTVDGGGGTP